MKTSIISLALVFCFLGIQSAYKQPLEFSNSRKTDDPLLYTLGQNKFYGHNFDRPRKLYFQNSGNDFNSSFWQDSSLPDSVREAWVSHYASGLLPGDDCVTDMTIDTQGNIYVAGHSRGPETIDDYVTIKYNSSGVEQWVARYNGLGNGSDIANALAVDAQGNVYVTGESYGSGTSVDFTTIKYNSFGAEQWVTSYNGTANSDDGAVALAIDAPGNVYVTGTSEGLGTSADYITIKYDASGVEQWVAQYNGPGNSWDGAYALAIDAYSNVYVTGVRYYYSGFESEYITIKYNTSGVEQWTAIYGGPGQGYENIPYDLTVDGLGSVYVTGPSGIWPNYNYATVKYNASGIEQWVAVYYGPGQDSYNIPYDLKVDNFGNVYVTGGSGIYPNENYATIKYNASGIEQWEAIYDRTNNNYDRAFALAVDANGNVYVTGLSDSSGIDYATIKYNASGLEQWVVCYNGPGNEEDGAFALILDSLGNVYVAGDSKGSGTGFDCATIKYDTSGVEQWVARYNGPGNSSSGAVDLAIDELGNVYVTGNVDCPLAGKDYATIKYNASGVEQWVTRYSGPGNSYDDAEALALDGQGNVYVTGIRIDSVTASDYTTVKYDASGVEQWVIRYNGPGDSSDRAKALAVDAQSNVYVTGSSQGLETSNDYATIKYDASGVELWVVRYNGPGNSSDRAEALAVDELGNVYVTGISIGSGTEGDFTTIKYNASGVEQWVARYNGLGNGYDRALALAIDEPGNVYVTGPSEGDYATIKYNASGIEQWVARYYGGGRADALAVDELGNVYVTGYGSDFDYVTIKYNASGIEQWVARYNGPGNSYEETRDITVDAQGNVYVTGFSGGDYATIKYNTLGIEQWVARYNGPGNSDDNPKALALDNQGNLFVTGSSDVGDWNVSTTIKYTQTPTGVEPEILNRPTEYKLSQNYPNPFNPKTNIELSIPKSEFVTLKIYNILGEEVAVLVSEKLAAGQYKYDWDAGNIASGVYFYRIQAGDYVDVKKMVFMK